LSYEYRFLLFDAVVLRQKGAAIQEWIILFAYGEMWEGRSEMIDFLLASSESQNV
jgi:transposase-like protein